MGFYDSAIAKSGYGLKADDKDEKTVIEIIKLIQDKELTVDRASRVLADAQTILPLFAKLPTV